VKVLGKTRAPGQTHHYTLKELENVVSALVDRVDADFHFRTASAATGI
jgi:hypothetical protein